MNEFESDGHMEVMAVSECDCSATGRQGMRAEPELVGLQCACIPLLPDAVGTLVSN